MLPAGDDDRLSGKAGRARSAAGLPCLLYWQAATAGTDGGSAAGTAKPPTTLELAEPL
jgi:hypothetical protein